MFSNEFPSDLNDNKMIRLNPEFDEAKMGTPEFREMIRSELETNFASFVEKVKKQNFTII